MDQNPHIPNTPQEPPVPVSPQPSANPTSWPQPESPANVPPNPGMYMQGAPNGPKKSNSKAIVIVACSVLALIAIGVGIYFLTKKPAQNNNTSSGEVSKKMTEEDIRKILGEAIDKDELDKIMKEVEAGGESAQAVKDQSDAINNFATSSLIDLQYIGAQTTIYGATHDSERGAGTTGKVKESELDNVKRFVQSKNSANKWFVSYGSTIKAKYTAGKTSADADTLILSTDKECATVTTVVDKESFLPVLKNYIFKSSPCDGLFTISITK